MGGMDPKLFASTFVAVFLAEMGDKTQLATMTLATAGSRITVFAAAALALVATTAVAVLAGDMVTRVVPPIWLRRGAGVIFIVLGVLYLFGKEEGEGPRSSDEAPKSDAPESGDISSS